MIALLAGCVEPPGRPTCVEAPCVADLATAVGVEPDPGPTATEGLVVSGDRVYAAQASSDVHPNHVAVFALPDLTWLGAWEGVAGDGTGADLAVEDVDGDGVDEVAVARPGWSDRAHTGFAYLLPPEPDGTQDIASAARTTFRGPLEVGVDAVFFADLDADGALDLGVSGPGTAVEWTDAGVYGLPVVDGVLGAADATTAVRGPYGVWWDPVRFDLDGDGRDELLTRGAGCRAHDLPLVDAEPEVVFEHVPPVIGSPSDTHVLGDVTGDGAPDLAVHFLDLPDEDRAGWVYVIPGGTWGGRVDTLPIQVHGTFPWDAMGRAAVSGDVDGDGVHDLVVGAPSLLDRRPGRVLVFRGPVAGVLTDADADAIVWGEFAGDWFGASLGVASVDGDAQADLVIGAPAAGLYVVPGAALF